MNYLDFLQHLKQIRIARGFSKSALSKAMGKSASYLSLIENNKISFKMEDYLRFCELLKIPPNIIFDCVLPQGEQAFLKKKLANLSPRDFRLVKDMIILMELNPEDL